MSRTASSCSLKSLLLLCLFLSNTLQVYTTRIEPRADCCIGNCPHDENGEQAPTLDGPTSDRSAGIGVEFETGVIQFASDACAQRNQQDTDDSKGKLVGNRQGPNWELTADSTGEAPGNLLAEYILDGKQIKVNSGKAREAAAAVAADLLKWNPSRDMSDNRVTIQDSVCTDWYIIEPETGGNIEAATWAPQLTVPLPLEAISDLFLNAVTPDANSELLPTINRGARMVYVTKDFFQAQRSGISPDAVKADVLGFFSLILSYAKHADEIKPDESPKRLISIMPRTDFTNVFRQVKPSIPGSLHDLVNLLACYSFNPQTQSVEVDQKFCSGNLDDPQPNGVLDQQKFDVSSSVTHKSDSCTVKEWIQSIEDEKSPDRLSEVDKIIDGSIGFFGDKLENVLNTQRAVPLFEFRRLGKVVAGKMKDRVDKMEQAVIDYHNTFANPPKFLRSRRNPSYSNIKRQACPAAGPATNSQPPMTPDAAQPTETPEASPQLTCNGVDTTKWMGRDALNTTIGAFCGEAEQQAAPDKDSGSIVRTYNNGGPDAVTISIDYGPDPAFKPNKDDCAGFLTTVMDSCDGNDPDHNPMNWKHGGNNMVSGVRYNVFPLTERYKAGICSMHITERMAFSGIDGPGTERNWRYHLGVDAKDASGTKIGGTGDNEQVGAGDKNSYQLTAYYNTMFITPEAQGGNYIQFAIDTQAWTTQQTEGIPRCEVGGWDRNFTPMTRRMDCFFTC